MRIHRRDGFVAGENRTANSLRALSSEHTTVLMAYKQRHEGTTTTFFTEAAQHFTLLEVSLSI